MINLMPDDAKVQLRAARTNVALLRYILIIFLAVAFLVLILFGSVFLLNLGKASSQQLIDSNNVKAEVYNSTKSQVDALSASLSEAKGILDQEVLYSHVLTNFAQQMPTGTVINKLTLNAASFGTTPMTIQVYAKTTNDAVALRDKFQSSPFFTKVSFQNISDSNGGIDGYPVSAMMTLSLTKAAAQEVSE